MTDFGALLRRLTEAGVEFVVIGGAAAVAHGSARLTQDLDVVYRRTDENQTRLAVALDEIAPYLRDAPPGLPFVWDARTIEAGLNFTLATTEGAIDLFGDIPGGGGYDELRPHTISISVFGIECLCLDLETLIRVKRAAGRPRDFDAVAELESLRELADEEPE